MSYCLYSFVTPAVTHIALLYLSHAEDIDLLQNVYTVYSSGFYTECTK